MVLAIALSSPKFGRLTRIPSILSRFLRKRAAHFFASLKFSIAPYLVSSSGIRIVSIPCFFKTATISFRPFSAKEPGNTPLFPIITPRVPFVFSPSFLKILSVFKGSCRLIACVALRFAHLYKGAALPSHFMRFLVSLGMILRVRLLKQSFSPVSR